MTESMNYPGKKTIILTSAFSLLILGRMLFPGYILTLDMVWTPEMPAQWQDDGLNNGYPISMLIHAADIIAPSWIVQKIMLFILFFLVAYIPFRFLPCIQNSAARFFAAGLYALNPFVYSRMLSGQWQHLFAYALLPLVLDRALELSIRPSFRSALRLSLSLVATGLFSIHFLYLSCILALTAVAASAARNMLRGEWQRALIKAKWSLAAAGMLIIASSYWIVPALGRNAPLERRFDEAHFEAFAAGGNGGVPAALNVAALGGFWGERYGWRYYFSWPQSAPAFWAAFAAVLAFALYGAYATMTDRRLRPFGAFMLFLCLASYVAALGASDTPFKELNMWLYRNIPGWSGLRDSHKIAGFLSLAYAYFAGSGAEALLARIRSFGQNFADFAPYAFAAVPAVFGMYMWGGFQNQLRPVWYPDSWQEARSILDSAQPEEKILVLPWHGYMSFDFNNQLVIANPARLYFGADRVIAGRSVEIGGVYDQERDAEYAAIDEFLNGSGIREPSEIHAFLMENKIKYVIALMRENALRREITGDSERWAYNPESSLTSGNFGAEILGAIPSAPIIEDAIILKKVNGGA